MNATLKAQWIAALRSGEYTQGNGQLRDKRDRFCCLGVLCEIAQVPYEARGDFYIYAFDNGLRGWAGLNGSLERQLTDDTESQLVDMNDGERKSFAEIADWIDANIPAEGGGQ